MTINSIQITIPRGSSFDTSYNLYVKTGGYPIEDGDGLLVANYPILPWITSLTVTYQPPSKGVYGFGIVPLSNDKIGPYNILGSLTTV